jgi:geranylgeranyl diphosphate synthase type I
MPTGKDREEYRLAVTAALQDLLADSRLPLYEMMRFHFGWTDQGGKAVPGGAGKMLRPILCLMACAAVGGAWQRALPAAAAIELVHNFSLVHDDVQDDDRQRRGRPTVWSLWGKPQAINVGTAMRVLASLALGRLELPAARIVRIAACLDRATLRLIEGQYLDISFETRPAVSSGEYLEMIRGKTAELIAAALETGALVGSEDSRVPGRLRELGLALGLAFQIRDDILGVWGDSALTGKPTGSDIARRKKTYPLVFAGEKTEGGLGERLRQLCAAPRLDPGQVQAVVSLLEEAGSRTAAQELVERYSLQALALLQELRFSAETAAGFRQMITGLVGRSA